MKSGFTRDGVLLAVASVAVAILLWLQVSLLSQPSKQKEMQVVLEPRSLPEDLILTEAPSAVNVVAEAGPDLLDGIRAQDVSAFVDLSEAKVGRRAYRVQWTAPQRLNPYLTLKQTTVSMTIARRKRIKMKVELIRTGAISPGLASDPANDVVSPDEVTIVGPEELVDQVRRAVVGLDMALVRISGVYPGPVEPRDGEDKPIPGLTIEPSTVTIRAAVQSAPTDRPLLVVPDWLGSPAFGFRVKDYEFIPKQVLVKGASEAVNAKSTIETEPIDLRNLRATTTVTVKLKPLEDKRARLSVDKVKVRIVLEPVKVDPAEDPVVVPPSDG